MSATHACDLIRAFCLRWPQHRATAVALSTFQGAMRDMLLIIGYRKDMKKVEGQILWLDRGKEANAARANREEPSLRDTGVDDHGAGAGEASEDEQSCIGITAVCFTSGCIAFSPCARLSRNPRVLATRSPDSDLLQLR